MRELCEWLEPNRFIAVLSSMIDVPRREARRLINEGRVFIRDEVLRLDEGVALDGSAIRVGKHYFIKLPLVATGFRVEEDWAPHEPTECDPMIPCELHHKPERDLQ